MSSEVPKSKRIKRKPRTKISEFSAEELLAINSAKQNFGEPVVLFGSRARGNWAEDSDIDIGVKGYNHKKHKALKEYMSQYCGIKVDLFKIENARTHNGAIEL